MFYIPLKSLLVMLGSIALSGHSLVGSVEPCWFYKSF